MKINSTQTSQSFQSKVVITKATKEACEYAKTQGMPNLLTEVNKNIKFQKNYRLNIKHHYSKPYDTSKTEVRYHNGIKECKYIVMKNNIKNPAELTFKILLELKDKTSKAFKEIFE